MSKARSRVTNGRAMFVDRGTDERSPIARRLRDLVKLHTLDASPNGPEHLSAAQAQLIRRISMIEVQAELMEAKLVAGDDTVDVESFARISSHLRRMYESIGLRKTKVDKALSLAELVAAHKTAKPAEKAAECARPITAIPVPSQPVQLVQPLSEPPALAAAPLALDKEAVA
jgi:hypothetical protein